MSRRGRSRPGAAGLIAALALVSPAAAPAQTAADSLAHRTLATRAELDSLARVLASAGSSAQRQTLELVRARLGAGDFQAGDRILLQIPALQSAVQPVGQPATLLAPGQQARADTFTVGREQQLTLPVGGTIPLRGVLKSELQGYLTEQLSQYLKYPTLHARPLIRVSVQGDVQRPGFYFIPPDAPLSDALMAAGGTLRDAKVKDLRVERNGTTILKGRALQEAMAAGRTLETVNLQDGDQLTVPSGGQVTEHMRFVWLVVSITGGIYGLTRLF